MRIFTAEVPCGNAVSEKLVTEGHNLSLRTAVYEHRGIQRRFILEYSPIIEKEFVSWVRIKGNKLGKLDVRIL